MDSEAPGGPNVPLLSGWPKLARVLILRLKKRIDAPSAVKPYWNRGALEQLEQLDQRSGCHLGIRFHFERRDVGFTMLDLSDTNGLAPAPTPAV